jgi:hypothetical protein
VTLRNFCLKENCLGALLEVPGIGAVSISKSLEISIKNTNHQVHENTTIPATILIILYFHLKAHQSFLDSVYLLSLLQKDL